MNKSQLKQIPSLNHLARMYYELSLHGARAIGLKKSWPYRIRDLNHLVVLAADMSRYDPRLLDILVEFLYNKWLMLNPLILRSLQSQMSSPQTLAVIFGFLLEALSQKEYQYFYDYVTQGLSPQNFQLYFINLYQPGSYGMIKAASEPIWQYYQWGFLAKERPILYDKDRRQLGHWGPLARQQILLRLANQKKSLTISDYLLALDHTITRQQALLDLKSAKFLKMIGKGRASVWTKN